MEVKNVWLETHGRRVDYLLQEIERYRLSGSYGGNLNLEEIITLFKGTKMEITRLQNENDKLKELIKEQEGQIEQLNKQTDAFFNTSDAIVDGD